MKNRNLFAELTEGFDALGNAHVGKQTLRTHVVEDKPAPEVTAAYSSDVDQSIQQRDQLVQSL